MLTIPKALISSSNTFPKSTLKLLQLIFKWHLSLLFNMSKTCFPHTFLNLTNGTQIPKESIKQIPSYREFLIKYS